MAEVTFDADRIALVTHATYEVSLMASTLKHFIAAKDSTGEIDPVARGMLIRMEKLGDIIRDAVGPETEEATTEGLRRALLGA